jgi:hypothetical protein
MLVLILCLNKERVWEAIKPLIVYTKTEGSTLKHTIYRIAVYAAVFGLIFLLDQWLVSVLGHGQG